MPSNFVPSPRIRKSPYFDATIRYGATAFSVYNRTYLPFGYADPETEFWNIVRHVTLWDVAAQRIVEISGPDALAFTSLLTPRDLTTCAIGQCKYVLITNTDGGIVNDPVLLRLAEDRFWLSRADSDLLLWTQGIAVYAGLDVSVAEPDVAALQLQGPKSRAVMQDLLGGGDFPLAYFAMIETEIDGIPVVVSRTGWTAELGYEIYLRDSARADEIWGRIMAVGADHDIAPAGPSRIRRIEAGIYDYGVDIDATTNPFEAGLEWALHLDGDRDFVGKAALKRIAAEGVTRKMVGVEVGGAPLVYNGEPLPVMSAAGRIGTVTSCVYSPRLEKNIGYAMLPLADAELGTERTVESPDGPRALTVVEKPFFDPQKTLARKS